MDTEILKQPRGCLRLLQWVFALLAFATCSNFSSYLEFSIKFKAAENCENPGPVIVKQEFSYPFRLDHIPHQTFPNFCKNGSVSDPPITFPGDFSSDAQFFVFTGVTTWLYCFFSLAIYVFFSKLYHDEQKNAPMIDFCATVIIAVFWLAGSSAWANSLNGLKNAANPNSWVMSNEIGGPCYSSKNGPIATVVEKCTATYMGSFGGANVSVIFGFLNFFLWGCNLWYLYKETSWFKQPGPVQGNQPDINVESPSSN